MLEASDLTSFVFSLSSRTCILVVQHNVIYVSAVCEDQNCVILILQFTCDYSPQLCLKGSKPGILGWEPRRRSWAVWPTRMLPRCSLTILQPVFWIMSTSLPKLMWVFYSRWSHKNMEKICHYYWMIWEHAEYAATLSVVHLDHGFSPLWAYVNTTQMCECLFLYPFCTLLSTMQVYCL